MDNTHSDKKLTNSTLAADNFTASILDFNLDLLDDTEVANTLKNIEEMVQNPISTDGVTNKPSTSSQGQDPAPGPSSCLASIASQTKKCSLPRMAKLNHTGCGTSPILHRDHNVGTDIHPTVDMGTSPLPITVTYRDSGCSPINWNSPASRTTSTSSSPMRRMDLSPIEAYFTTGFKEKYFSSTQPEDPLQDSGSQDSDKLSLSVKYPLDLIKSLPCFGQKDIKLERGLFAQYFE